MPTINYCDFAAGNDSTGDGTAGNPYKTIDKASTGLTGGDEVRCAKSPAPSAMSGTMTFTNGSTSVATSQDLTGSLAAKDFIGLNTAGETWWEISSINSTTITLVVAYSGSGGTATGYKLGITDTGAAVSGSTVVQSVSVSGITISGGWDLSGPTQDGQTIFCQTGSSGLGRGLQIASKSYIAISKLGFLRYYAGMYLNSFDGVDIDNGLFACSGNTYGIYTPTATSRNLSISNSKFSAFGQSAINITTQISGVYISDCVFRKCGFAFSFANAANVIAEGCYFYDQYAIFNCTNILAAACACWCSHDESTYSNILKSSNWHGNISRLTMIQESESGGAAKNRVIFPHGGYTQDNAADARSGKCVQFNPKSATYWIEQSFFVPAAASTARTVAIYLKDDSSFNGSVWLELWFNGVKIAGPTEKTMTTSYVQESITGAADDIPVAGVLELKVLVYGTAGCVYADDISYS